jgi:ribosomal-protein-alanine N-acetyltransferase
MDGLGIRWLIRKDLKDVMRIDKRSFKHPYTEEDFLLLLKQRNNIGMVGSIGGHIVAFMIYELIKDRLDLKTLAVDADVRRAGIGRAMIERLAGKLSLDRRTMIDTRVRERNLPAQLFLVSQGFVCEETERDAYEETDESEYLFVHSIKPRFNNRITQYLKE